jgi:hypothetical protein
MDEMARNEFVVAKTPLHCVCDLFVLDLFRIDGIEEGLCEKDRDKDGDGDEGPVIQDAFPPSVDRSSGSGTFRIPAVSRKLNINRFSRWPIADGQKPHPEIFDF